MLFRKLFTSNHFGQSALELTVFGAVLLFTLGVIIRVSVSTNQRQHRQLSVSRWAMIASFLSSEGCKDWGGPGACPMDSATEPNRMSPGNASRLTASVLILEDRLNPESGKYGAIDRVPHMYSGSATHSRNLFYPVAPGEKNSLPMFDLFVNGTHFAFWMANEKRVGTSVREYEDVERRAWGWHEKCARKYVLPGEPFDGRDRLGNYVHVGCAVYLTKTYNNPDNEALRQEFGYYYGGPNEEFIDNNLPVDCRFSLGRQVFLEGPDGEDIKDSKRAHFSWQWRAFAAFVPSKNRSVRLSPEFEYHNSRLANYEEFNTNGNACSKTFRLMPLNLTDQNNMFDVDGDLEEEKIVRFLEVDVNGAVTLIQVIDYQDGDVNFKQDGNHPEYKHLTPVGFNRDMEIRTELKDGTYALMMEGKLYTATPERQYIRTVSKKDHLDIISRKFQLSNNTHRFCVEDTGKPAEPPGIPEAPLLLRRNPVDVCCSTEFGCCDNKGCTGATSDYCFSDLAWNKTCFDTQPGQLVLYIRSRIEDFHGRKWLTDLSNDPSVDLITPMLP